MSFLYLYHQHPTLPGAVEADTLVRAVGEIWDEREVVDLGGRPPKLEYHHKRGIVHKLRQVWRILTRYTAHKQEGETQRYTHTACNR